VVFPGRRRNVGSTTVSLRRRTVLVAAAVAVLAILTTAVLWRPGTRGASLVPQDRPGPVLLVPGYGGNTSSLLGLASALRQGGREVTVVELPGDGTGDLRVQAGRLKAAAERARAAGAASVDVVGYSAGGVVTRIWAARLGGSAVARRVVTLGSPHHGTTVAELGAALAPASCPLACRQLVPDSELLDQLDETPDGPVWTSVWTAVDETVTPPESARVEGGLDVELQRVCPDARTTHGQLPRDPLVVGLVDRALAATPLTAVPPPGQCEPLRARGTALLR